MTYLELENLSRKWTGKVCLFGAGLIGKTWSFDIIKAAGFTIDFYCDNHCAPGTVIRDNVAVISPETLYLKRETMENDILVFLTVKQAFQKEIEHQLLLRGINQVICMGDEFLQEFIGSIPLNDTEIMERYKDVTDDGEFLKRQFYVRMHKSLNLLTPQTFNEKIQWLKLYNRKSQYTMLVDKYEVKKIVAGIIGEKYIIPTLEAWDSFDEIDFSKLPNQFVLKCTHDSGGIVVCTDKDKLNKDAIKPMFEECLQRNYYLYTREWPYKNVKPRIIAEEYLENDEEGLHDYKIWCFNGKPIYIQYITGRSGERTYEGFYNTEWELQNFSYYNPRMDKTVSKPSCLEELLNLASQLAKGHPFLRCDFYILEDGSIRFGEITFYPMSGLESWKPCEMDKIIGDKIDLQSIETIV